MLNTSENKRLIFIKQLFKILITVLAFAFTIETCARFDDVLRFDAPFWGTYTDKSLRTIDESGINRNVPNSSFEKWKNNSLGFRGEEVLLEKPTGLVRVVCMGTSETYGLYESANMEWPAQLQSLLPNSARYQVINASVVGMPLNKYRAYIEKYVVKIKPDIIILFINPYAYVMGSEKANKHSEDRYKRQHIEEKKKYFSFRAFEKLKLKFKAEVKQELPADLLKKYRVWQYSKIVNETEMRRLKNKLPMETVSQSHVDAFGYELNELIKYLKQQNIQVVLSSYPVLLQPGTLEAYNDIFIESRVGLVEYSFNGLIDISEKINLKIKDAAQKSGVGYVDIDSMVPKNLQYFADHVHYTDDGAHKVALAIKNYIVETNPAK